MRFSQDFIQRVLESNNIVDIISQYTQLRPAAGGFMGLCPFPDHPEKKPSFSVSESKQVYNCFGCGKQGNIFRFLEQYNGMSFREAVEYLADRARIPIPEDSDETRDQANLAAKKKRELQAANKLAAQFFFEQYRRLPPGHHAREYVAKRGLAPETLQTFQIGYAPEEWDGLVQYLRSKGVSAALAEEARLIKARKEGTGHFDLFRDRLMFPIHNQTGEPIAFGGRVIRDGEPKYLNSPETALFTKGKVLYGLSQTARFIRAEDQVFVVEGYMDLVSLYQSGIQNVVATMGTALTSEHGRILKRMTKNVVALFDGDQAGMNAAEKALPVLLAAEVHPKGLILPDEMDPDDFMKARGPEALKELLTRVPDLFSLVFAKWTQNFRGEASEKVDLCDRLQPIFGSIRDLRLRSLYIREVQTRLGVDERWLMEALSLSSPSASRPAPRPTPAATPPPASTPHVASEASVEGVIALKGAPSAELMLLGLVLKNRAYWDDAWKGDILQHLTHPGVKMVLEKAAELARQGPEKFDKLTGLLSSFVDHSELLLKAGEPVGSRALEVDDMERQEIERGLFRDCFRKVKDLALKAEVERIQRLIRSSSPSPELMERLMKVQRERLALSKDVPEV